MCNGSAITVNISCESVDYDNYIHTERMTHVPAVGDGVSLDYGSQAHGDYVVTRRAFLFVDDGTEAMVVLDVEPRKYE